MRKSAVLMTLAIMSAGLMCAQTPKTPEKANFETYGDRMVTGDALTEDEMAQARKGFATKLVRPDNLDFGQNAQYEIAEIQLSHGKAREAVAKLRELAAAQPGVCTQTPVKADETVWVTHFNIAEVLRVALNNADDAAKEFQQVNGILQPLAQREMLDMLEQDPKKFDLAVATLEKTAAEAKEKGARWALLTRLGNLYRRTKHDDKAQPVFERIAQEATPDAIEALRRQAAAEAESSAKQISRLRESDRDEEADDLEQELVRRCNALRIQGRHEEAAAMQSALDKIDAEQKNLRPSTGVSAPMTPEQPPDAPDVCANDSPVLIARAV